MTYIVQADLEARLSPLLVRQVLDDDLDGVPDAAALALVIADSESYVEGFLRGNYDLDVLRAQGVNCPHEVKRLCLDVATAYMDDRHPQYIRANGMKILDRARRDLTDLRNSTTRLDVVGSPEPPANQTHIMTSGDPENPEPQRKFFNNPDSFGIY